MVPYAGACGFREGPISRSEPVEFSSQLFETSAPDGPHLLSFLLDPSAAYAAGGSGAAKTALAAATI